MDDDDYGAEFDQMVSETDKKVSTPANDANDNLEAPKQKKSFLQSAIMNTQD